MGSQSVKAIKSKTQRREFEYHLLKDLEALEIMIKTKSFEKGIQRIGAEQELCIVDKYYRPSFNALEILKNINDPHFTTELGLFNIEANLDPLVLKEKCFSKLENDVNALLAKAYQSAEQVEDNKIILAGILPTFKRKDLVFENMTPHKRYKVLNEVIKSERGKDFSLHVRGVDELILDHESILFESCNTSFQVHLQIDLENIIDQYNWAQAISGPVLSVMTNSPMLLGRELWSETRIALFQQSIDLRNKSHLLREQQPRVSFGSDWIRNSILELFTDDVTRYAPLVTSDFNKNALEELNNGIKPKLKAIGLHNGTLYKWNRLCYGVQNNIAHLRIENRYIPSGPSVKDEIANAMFWVGVMLGMPEDCRNIWKRMEFKDARGNFIKAARTGMDTYFNWFNKGISAKELAKEVLLPLAYKGLKKANIDLDDINNYLEIIEKRIDNNITGSKWLVRSSRSLQKEVSREEANILLTYHLYKNQIQNKSVIEWDIVKSSNHKDTYSKNKVYKVMTTEVFVVNENDSVELIKRIMIWKKINHLPVIDRNNKIAGIISSSNLLKDHTDNMLFAKDIMTKNIKVATPEMKLEDAKAIMIDNNIGCLPILDQDELVGILTKTDVAKISNSK